MADFSKIFYILSLAFLLIGLFFNLYPNLPRLPGDIYIDKPGIKVYIPLTSALVLSIIISILLNFLRK